MSGGGNVDHKPGHQWSVSTDNNRAGIWTCSVCARTGYFLGIPDSLDGFSGAVRRWVTYESDYQVLYTCIDLSVVEIHKE